MGFAHDTYTYVPDDMDPPATATDTRQEGQYQHERQYTVNAVVRFGGQEYRATTDVSPFTPPPTTPWEDHP